MDADPVMPEREEHENPAASDPRNRSKERAMVRVIDKGVVPADHPIDQEPWTVTPGRAGSPNESADDLDDGDGEPTDESWQHEQSPAERARFVQVFAGDPTWSYGHDHSFSGHVTIGDLFGGYGHIQREIPWRT